MCKTSKYDSSNIPSRKVSPIAGPETPQRWPPQNQSQCRIVPTQLRRYTTRRPPTRASQIQHGIHDMVDYDSKSCPTLFRRFHVHEVHGLVDGGRDVEDAVELGNLDQLLHSGLQTTSTKVPFSSRHRRLPTSTALRPLESQ